MNMFLLKQSMVNGCPGKNGVHVTRLVVVDGGLDSGIANHPYMVVCPVLAATNHLKNATLILVQVSSILLHCKQFKIIFVIHHYVIFGVFIIIPCTIWLYTLSICVVQLKLSIDYYYKFLPTTPSTTWCLLSVLFSSSLMNIIIKGMKLEELITIFLYLICFSLCTP